MRVIIILLLFNLVFSESFDGLTLITDKSNSPFSSILIDNDYNIINEWAISWQNRPSSIAYLMPDSSLILPCRGPGLPEVGNSGGVIKRFDWSGNLLWEYYFNMDE